MIKVGNLSLKRRLITAFALVFCCLALAVVGTLTGNVARTEHGSLAEPPAVASKANPFRNYESLEVKLYDEGVVIYSDFTTAAGLKTNLVVTGTVGGSTYTLYDDEYIVSVDGSAKSDDDEISFENVTEDMQVEVAVTSGTELSETEAILVNVKSSNDKPDYTNIRIANKENSLDDDHTVESLKKFIKVEGNVGGSYSTIVNRELYTLTMTPDPIKAGSSVTVNVELANKPAVKTSKTFTGTIASIEGVYLSVNPEYKYVDGYYYNGDYSAFVQGMTQKDVYSGLVVTAEYPHSRRALKLEYDGESLLLNTALSTGERITLATDASAFNQNSVVVGVTVQDQRDKAVSGSITLFFEAWKIIKIYVDSSWNYTPEGGWNATSTVTASMFIEYIYYTDNAGRSDKFQNDSDLEVVGTLTPEYNSGSDVSKKDNYDKDIVIRLISDNSIFTTVTIKKIANNIAVTRVGSDIVGNPATQVYHHEFDYSGLTLAVTYSNRTTKNIPLTDIKDLCTLTLYSGMGADYQYTGKIDGDIITPEVKYGTIEVDASIFLENAQVYPYELEIASGGQGNMVISPDTKELPSVNFFSKEYSKGLTLQFTNPTSDGEYWQSATKRGNISIEGVYSDSDCITEAKDEKGSPLATVNDANHSVTFNAGMTYYVKLVMERQGEGGPIEWNWATISNADRENISVNGDALIYKIVVTKGIITLSLEFEQDSYWTYGDTEVKPIVYGTNAAGVKYTLKEDGNGDIEVGYHLYYYGWDNYTWDNPSDVVPKNVGTYYVIAITYDTLAYASAKTSRGRAETVEIKARPIELDGLIIDSPTYIRGKTYGYNEIINVSSLVSGDTVSSVMSFASTDSNNPPYTHAGSYGVKITLVNSNYVWASGVSTESGDKQSARTTFTIKARSLAFKVVGSMSFTYGETNPTLSPSYLYDDDYDASAENFTGSKTHFYAEIDSAATEYYESNGVTKIDLSTKPFNAWTVGNYRVKYITKLGAGDAVGDYSLPFAWGDITVTALELTEISFSSDNIGDNTEYDAQNHTVNLVNWGAITTANSHTYDDIFTVSIDAKRQDGTTLIDVTSARTQGVITLTEAGKYTVTVSFKNNNYAWIGGGTDAVISNEFEIKQRVIVINGVSAGELSFKYEEGKAQYPVPTLTGVSTHTLTPTTKIYEDFDCANSILPEKVEEVGTYYIVIEDFSVVGTDKANYILPEEVKFAFDIVAAELVKPNVIGDAISVYYVPHTSYEIRNSVTNWDDDFKLTSGTEKLVIKVYNGDIVSEWEDVIFSGGAVTHYDVYFVPADNYSWGENVANAQLPGTSDGNNAYKITLTVNPITATFDWSDCEKVYNESAQQPTVVVTNAGSYDVYVTVGYQSGSGDVESAINAGNYTVYAKELTGGKAHNYVIEKGNSDYSHAFVIKKATIAKIEVPEVDITYPGTGEVAFKVPSGYTWAKLDGIVTASVSTTSGISESTYAFRVSDGKFTYQNAGEYIFTFSITASNSNNYCWAGDGEEEVFTHSGAYVHNPERHIVVKKAAITKFAVPNVNITYPGTGEVQFSVSGYTWAQLTEIVAAKVVGNIPSAWLSTAPSIDERTYAFRVSDGKFTYQNAGEYAFTFTIIDSDNYCWADEDKETDFGQSANYVYAPEKTVTVNRKVLTAPALGDDRAMEWETAHKITFEPSKVSAPFDIKYGKCDSATGTETGEPTIDWPITNVQSDLGEYYVQLSITSGALNYLWAFDESDTFEAGYVRIRYTTNYDENGVWIRLHFAITNTLLDVQVKFKSYTFGDNGTAGIISLDLNDELGKDISAAVYLTSENSSHLEYALNGSPKLSALTFTLNGQPYTDLVNGLPWRAGTYSVSGRVDFGNGNVYQPIQFAEVELVVKPFVLNDSNVEWGNLSCPYTSQEQVPTATIIGIPERGDGKDPVSYDALLIVSLADGAKPTHVDTYRIVVRGITGVDNGNFELPSTPIAIDNFEITPIAVGIEGTAVSGHVYGDEINALTEKKWHYASGSTEFFNDGAEDCLEVVILNNPDGDGSEIDRYAAAGNYYVTVRFKTDTQYADKDYTVTFATATFTVVNRELTVFEIANSAKSTYGDEVDLFALSNGAYKYFTLSTSNGKDDGPLADKNIKEVFSLKMLSLPNDSTLKAPVGSYAITCSPLNSNFTITFPENWEFEIENADIDDEDSIAANEGFVYNAKQQQVLKSGYSVKLVNHDDMISTVKWEYAVVKEGVVGKWVKFDDSSAPEEKNAGTYSYRIRVTADNHNPLEVPITFTISKATLTVSVSFDIYYGEKSPADENIKYLMTLADLRKENGKYTVKGLMDSDKTLFYGTGDFYSLSGEISYTTDYTQGSSVQNYNLTPDVSKLSCGNYDFKAAEGVLTVNKVELIVKIVNRKVTYGASSLPSLTDEGDAFTVVLPKSTYNSALDLVLIDNYISIFELKSDATTPANTKVLMNNVGTYDIVGTNKRPDYYEITFSGSKEGTKGIYTVSAAELTVATVTGFDITYDEHEHGLNIGNECGGEIAATVDQTPFTVTYYESRILEETIDDDVLADCDELDGEPKYIDVTTTYRYVYYRIEAANHKIEYGVVAVRITMAKNEFTTEFKFANNEQKKYKSSSDYNELNAAWVYGVYTDEVTDGYNKEGNQAITEPIAKFKRDRSGTYNNAIQYSLRYKTDLQATEVVFNDIGEDHENLRNIFNYIFSKGGFNAGYYRLIATVAETNNYEVLSESWIFYVAKRDLYVTANDAATIYGTDKDKVVADFSVSYSGFVSNVMSTSGVVGAVDTLAKVLGDILFETDYKTGSFVADTYYIRVANQGSYTPKNYDVHFIDGHLSVGKREVTIYIDNKENTYNLHGGEKAAELTFSVKNSLDFYGGDIVGTAADGVVASKAYNNDNQKVIELVTKALTSTNGRNTNDVIISNGVEGGYTIYAIFKGSNYELNYLITFTEDCAMSELGGGAITQTGRNNAGKFTIHQAKFSFTYEGVYHDVGDEKITTGNDAIYSGGLNYSIATINDTSATDGEDVIEYTYKDASGKIYKGGVIDVGTYYVTISSNSPNYKAEGTVTLTIHVTQATITITAKEGSSIVYGSLLEGNVSGFDYEYSSEHLLPDVLAEYMRTHTVTYTSNNYAPNKGVDSSVDILPVCAGSANITISSVSAPFTIKKREVTVAIAGCDENNTYATMVYHGDISWNGKSFAQATLDGLMDVDRENKEELAAILKSFIKISDETAVFGYSGDDRSALGIKLSLPTGTYKAGKHTMAPSSNAKNYLVKYSNVSPALFEITRAELTLYAQVKEDAAARRYGDSFETVCAALTYTVEGLQNSESFTSLLNEKSQSVSYKVVSKTGSKAYEQWISGVGDYTVSINTLEDFENYVISGYVSITLNIKPLIITASTEDQIYTEDGTNYHEGVYGKAHEAVITFAYSGDTDDSIGKIINGEVLIGDVSCLPKFSLSYTTVKTGDYQVAKAAPRFAGNYTVTVSLLSSGNYAFGDGVYSHDYAFNVEKKVISDSTLSWTHTPVYDTDLPEEGGFVNSISNFISSIMSIDSFHFTAQLGGSGNPIEKGDAGVIDKYYYSGEMLLVTVNKFGTYTVTFRLIDSALNNYKLDSRNATVVISSFTVTATKVDLKVKIANWTYGDPSAYPEATINGLPVVTNIDYTYALLKNIENIGDYVDKGDDFFGYNRSEIEALIKGVSFRRDITFNAGYYVLCATFDGVLNNESITLQKYYVFYVNQRELDAPTVETSGYVYNGKEWTIALTYDRLLIRATFTGRSTPTANGAEIYATNKGSYVLTFHLTDETNYKWKEGTELVDGAVKITWEIAIDDAENNPQDTDHAYITVAAENSHTYGDSFNRGIVTVKTGYEGEVTFFYAERTADSVETEAQVEWTKGTPAKSGSYWIKAVLSDGNNNYTDKSVIGKYTVAKRRINAVVSGYITYGDAFDPKSDTIRYEIVGLIGQDTVSVGDYNFVLYSDAYGVLQAGGDYLVTLVCDPESGEVLGITAADYEITPVAGKLTVNKRSVTVTIGNAEGDFAVFHDVSGVALEVSRIIAGDDLGVTLSTDAQLNSSVGNYWINYVSHTNTNYEVAAWNRGIYTVKPLAISFTLEPQTGAVYGDEIWGATYGDLVIGNPAADEDIVRSSISLSLRITGMTYGGVPYASVNDDDRPSEAGVYTASVIGISSNFSVTTPSEVQFVIAKKEFDVTKLSIASRTYTGSELTPVITDTSGLNGIYTAAISPVVDAGDYNVVLTLSDANNYAWSATDAPTYTLIFTVEKADDSLVGVLKMQGWQYGTFDAALNSPLATVKSGSEITFEYSSDGVSFVSVLPATGDAGKYYVRAVTSESKNYYAFVSEAVEFEISRFVLTTPTLGIITEGEGKNDTFTGSDLSVEVLGFDIFYMQIEFDGNLKVSGSTITVHATNANTYKVKLSLLNALNYRWSTADDPDDDGFVTLTWTVVRMKISKPTVSKQTFVVNGNPLTYIPEGFDGSIMNIENNVRSYGGKSTVKVTLKDTSNYEWEDGSTDAVLLDWNIIGQDVVYAVLVSVLSVLTAAGVGGVLAQYLLNKRRKRVPAGDAPGAPEGGGDSPEGGEDTAVDGQESGGEN